MRVFVDFQFLLIGLVRLKLALMMVEEDAKIGAEVKAIIEAFEKELPELIYILGKGKNHRYGKSLVQVMTLDRDTLSWHYTHINATTALQSAERLYLKAIEIFSKCKNC